VIDPNDAGSYLPDTHFTDEADRRLASELERIIRDQMARPNVKGASHGSAAGDR
jgi:hypothetical protein